jgi:uncharacterized protein (TIGR00369 family)
MNDMTARRRTIQWDDPATAARDGLSRPGMGYLNAIMSGEIPRPPMAWTLDFALVEAEEGRAVFECEPKEFHYNPSNHVHGGLAMALIDSATGCALHSTLAVGEGFTTVETSTQFVRPMKAGMGKVRCEGRLLHRGRTLGRAEAKVTDAEGRLLAYGHSICMILKLDERRP